MKNDNRFDLNSFISPDNTHAPVYIWVWNDVCTREIIDMQLSEMQNLGIRAFYILPEPKNFRPDSMPTNLAPAYLSDGYFALCAYAIEQAKSRGMHCWIYDEGGWPSGSACGKVMQDHPEYGQETLAYHERSFLQGDAYEKSNEDILVAFVNDAIVEQGYIFPCDCVVTEYFIKKDTAGRYPDLLNKSATEYFIETTHKKYGLQENITALFTDEPKAPARAFNKELKENYEALYGESVLPYLPLISERAEVTQENVHILYRWYDLCSRMFCENYLLPCKKWANENGIAFTGHLDKDHAPLGCVQGGNNFNLMRALRCFDIPGVDVIYRQLYPENKTAERNDMNSYNGFFPRYASSAAAHNGTNKAMSEVFAVAGAAVTYDFMRFTVGYQAVRGINIFNLFNFPLGRKGALLAQELPVFTEKQPYCRFLGQFNRYAERLCYVSSLGNRICETALYYPVSDFQGRLHAQTVAETFDSLGRALEDMAVDFDIVDDDVLQSAEIKDGCLCIGDAEYRNIIIPEGVFLPDATQKALHCFTELGGRVADTPADCKPVIRIEGKGLRAMHRKTENAEIFCLFRETGENAQYKIHLPSTNGYLLDLENGALQKLKTENGILTLSLSVGETAVIVLTDETFPAADQKECSKTAAVLRDFDFRKQTELIFNENGFDNIRHSEKGASVTTGDWADLLGCAYSGSGVYETAFTLPEMQVGRAGVIDLGDVHFAAEVILNGHSLGTAVMPPYRINIPAGISEKNNTLRVTVTNTAANQYLHTDYFAPYKTEELSPYFASELYYAKDFASGGLYGPVVIYTEE